MTDSVAVATIQANTLALQANTTAMGTLTGVLLVFMGAFIFTICGYLCIRYTLRG